MVSVSFDEHDEYFWWRFKWYERVKSLPQILHAYGLPRDLCCSSWSANKASLRKLALQMEQGKSLNSE